MLVTLVQHVYWPMSVSSMLFIFICLLFKFVLLIKIIAKKKNRIGTFKATTEKLTKPSPRTNTKKKEKKIHRCLSSIPCLFEGKMPNLPKMYLTKSIIFCFALRWWFKIIKCKRYFSFLLQWKNNNLDHFTSVSNNIEYF